MKLNPIISLCVIVGVYFGGPTALGAAIGAMLGVFLGESIEYRKGR